MINSSICSRLNSKIPYFWQAHTKPVKKLFERTFSTIPQEFSRTMSVLENKQIVSYTVEEFLKKTHFFKKLHLDLGTGDGKFLYKQAKLFPETYYIGIDANLSNMSYLSWKVCCKPSRGGGQKNIALIHSLVEHLPEELCSIGDSMTINFPWSSLLHGLVTPDRNMLSRIVRLGKKNSSIQILLNYTIFQNHVYREKLQLPHVTTQYVHQYLKGVYLQEGIRISEVALQNLSINASSWGKSLTLSGNREVLLLSGSINRV